jgi:D-tyrosyl-tRNA(Tyr) deacylase
VQHTIKWTEDTDAVVIGKAIEDVLKKVKNPTPRVSVGKDESKTSIKINSK